MDNYKVLEEFRPTVSEFIEKNMEEVSLFDDKTVSVETGTAKDGNTILSVRRRDKNGEEKPFRLNSAYRPIQEAERWGKQYEINDINAVYLIFGLGNGYFVRELMKKMKGDTVLIVYEPSPKVFKECMENSDISDIIKNDRVILVIKGINDEYLPQALDRVIFWANMNTIKKCTHPQYDMAFPEEMLEYDKIVWDGYTKARSNVNTAAKFQTVFAPNTLYSMSLMRDSNILLDLYDSIDRDVPVIIASAGPSLEKNIDGLKEIGKRAYIMAVDKTIPIFMKHDIMPDFMITIDAKKWPGYFANPKCHNIPLFCLFEASKIILARHTGRKIFFDSSEYPKAILMMAGKQTTAFNAGGSVATAAYTICLALGMKNIILIGQDLAYLDGKTHAGNMTSGEINNGGEGNRREVEGIDGNKVVTRIDWFRYLDWFGNAIESNPQCHVIDATEGGAKIRGTQILTLREAIETYCTKETDVKEMMENLPPALNENQYLAMIDYVRASSMELVLIKGKLRHAIDDCEKLIRACKNGTINEQKYNKPIKELSKTNQYVEGRPVYKLLDSLVVTEAVMALKDVYVQSDDPDENLRKTFEQSRDFYKALLDAADKLDPILERTLKDMETDIWEFPHEIKNLNVLIVMFGLGDGRYLRKVLKKAREDTRILVCEPQPLNYILLSEKPEMADILSDSRLCIAMGNEELERYSVLIEGRKEKNEPPMNEAFPVPVLFYDALNREYTGSGEKLVICHPQYDIAFPGKYRKFNEEIEEGKKRQIAQKNTRRAYGKKIARNQLTALSLAKQAVLLGSLRKRLSLENPVLIVSTGPSLAESIDFIKKIKDSVYIIAVDSSVNFLLNRDIRPDFIVTVDPNKWKEHFKKEEAKNIPLFCRMDSNLFILKNQSAPLIYFGSTPYGAAVLERFGKKEDWIEDTGGSVSTAALSVSLKLGFKRIILVGQDLCYKTEDGGEIKATHANGLISSDEKKQGFEREYIEGNTEEKVLTRQDWYRYLKWIEKEAAKHSDVLIQNATKGGAKISGVPHISQEELIEELSPQSLSTRIEGDESEAEFSGDSLFSDEEYGEYSQYLKGLLAQLKDITAKAHRVKILSGELKRAAKQHIIGKKSYQKSMQEVADINKEMQDEPLYLLAELLVPEDDDEEIYCVKDDEMENLFITYKQVELMYDKLETAFKELKPLVEEVLSDV